MQDPTMIRLPSGMRMIVAEDHATPVVAIGFFTDVGACDEPADRRGIAHFLEHMMFRGSEHVASEEHARIIARFGGVCNAGTSPDSTMYYEIVPTGAVEEVFRLEADRFQHLHLTDEHTEIERKVILEELRLYENQPAVRAMLAIQKRISAGHPYGTNPLGHREHLEALTTADLEAFFARCYRPQRVVAVVCGDVETQQVKDLTERYFGPWRNNGTSDTSTPPVYEPKVGKLALRVPFEVPLVAQVYRIRPMDEIDIPAMKLLTSLLASGEASPVCQALVRRRKLCVTADCIPMPLARGGLFILFGAFLPPARHAPRRAVMQEVIAKFTDELDGDLFHQHLKLFRKDQTHDAYSHHSRMEGLGRAELLEGGFEHYHDSLSALAKVTPQRVAEFATSLFGPQNTLELDITPEKSKWWLVPLGLGMRILRR